MKIRNVAIIAHVDHGKTTLVDGMLKQTHTFRDNQAEMQATTILDSNELEREKEITILAKNTAVFWGEYKVNIIDTPGHADFSGEVERVINMADGAVLVVDAAEGPLPQTQFVLEKALEQNLKIIVVINKIDRQDARPEAVLRQTEELFVKLAKYERHLEFPVLYAVGREGKVWKELPKDFSQPGDLQPLFEEIINTVPAPAAEPDKPFAMLVSTLDFDSYKGTYAIGKVTTGVVKPGQRVNVWEHETKVGTALIQNVFTSRGLEREEVGESEPGDIIALTGIADITIGQTVADISVETGYPTIKLGEPTIKVTVSPNSSPFAGKEGKFFTARQLEDRLMKEIKTNIGMKIRKLSGGGFVVAGRGELHLAILIENLRREGYELEVGRPEVIVKTIDGKQCEPFEEVTIEVGKEHMGIIIEEMGKRKATLVDTHTNDRSITRMVYRISSRNLLGFRGDILTATRGTGMFASMVLGYFAQEQPAPRTRSGVLVSMQKGAATAYALETLQERGTPFISPGVQVYGGMIVGLNKRRDDLEVNVCKIKNLSNVHNANSDIDTPLDAPTILSLEQAVDFIEDDELLEVTPQSLRLRKKILDHTARMRAARATESSLQ
jgi:GTP-binding protein